MPLRPTARRLSAPVAKYAISPLRAGFGAEVAGLDLRGVGRDPGAAQDLRHALDDLVADYAELKTAMGGQSICEAMIYSAQGGTFRAAGKLHKLIGLSAAMPRDAAFARQTRRKYL